MAINLTKTFLLETEGSYDTYDTDPRLALALKSFAGRVGKVLGDPSTIKVAYVYGPLQDALPKVKPLCTICVIQEFTPPEDLTEASVEKWMSEFDLEALTVVSIGQVPLSVPSCPSSGRSLGVLFPSYFHEPHAIFERLTSDHTLQGLRESDKPTLSYRNGIYLTPVTPFGHDKERLYFRLLRCSTNLTGPTDTFKETDKAIVQHLNETAPHFFDGAATLNHVLAQVYNNFRSNDGKDRKAKIRDHSDKTKDMPPNGIMAFCTFYRGDEKLSALKTSSSTDPYDLMYKKGSALTRLRFRRKTCVTDPSLVPVFEVNLYPGSVFMMDLEVNRLYTHETAPSYLPIEHVPTRMGYVVRCSDQEACYDRETERVMIQSKVDGTWVPLEPPTKEGVNRLRELYAEENYSSDKPLYDHLPFSLNEGDYLCPTY